MQDELNAEWLGSLQLEQETADRILRAHQRALENHRQGPTPVPVPMPPLPAGRPMLTRADVSRMTPEEINRCWDTVKEALKN